MFAEIIAGCRGSPAGGNLSFPLTPAQSSWNFISIKHLAKRKNRPRGRGRTKKAPRHRHRVPIDRRPQESWTVFGWAPQIWQLVVAVGVVLGLIVTLDYFVPTADISLETPLSTNDAFSAPFVVENAGNISLKEVMYSCRFNNLQTMQFTHVESLELTSPPRPIALLIDRHDRATGICGTQIEGSLASADIEIAVFYKSWATPWFRSTRRRFVLTRGSDAWRWEQEPPLPFQWDKTILRSGFVKWENQ
jgi:hypothetical protein